MGLTVDNSRPHSGHMKNTQHAIGNEAERVKAIAQQVAALLREKRLIAKRWNMRAARGTTKKAARAAVEN